MIMGADLTIVKNSEYFRDAYNETNILWRVGLSYWGLSDQIKIGKIGRTLSYRQVRILKREVEKRKPEMDKFLETIDENWLKKHNCEGDVAGWVDFWKKKYEKFITFLDHAIELKSGIRWSV